VLLTISSFAIFAGCSSHSYVRHLASDASLIVPQKSTTQEVVSLLGQPDQRRSLIDGTEELVYFQTNKSFLRSMPFIGDKIGQEEFDLVVVLVKQDVVISCTYRLLKEEEFWDSGIKSDVQLNAK
jgi:hypothetical protein